MGRFLILVVFLAALILIPFFLWGDGLEQVWSVSRLERYGAWAWAVGIALLTADLLLPLPSTVIMSALGYVYGPFLGGALAALGALCGAVTGYGLCRALGDPMARRLAGAEGLHRGRALFLRHGPWLVALSRWIPVLAEVIACLAGLTRMPVRRFLFAAACGCLPLGLAFAWVGHLGAQAPGLALACSALAPPLLWTLVGRRLLATPSAREPSQPSS